MGDLENAELIILSSSSFLNTTSFPEFATSCLPPNLMASSSYVFFKYDNPFPSALNLSLLYLSRNSFLQVLCLMSFSSFVTLILSNSLQIFIFLRVFFFFFFLLYKFVLVLLYINMHLPRVYMCSPSWTPLPPPSLYHPSGSSQCTSPERPVSRIKPGLARSPSSLCLVEQW